MAQELGCAESVMTLGLEADAAAPRRSAVHDAGKDGLVQPSRRRPRHRHGGLGQTAQDFHARVPGMSAQAFETVVKHALPLIIGLWSLSNPAEVAARVIELPGLESLRYDFELALLSLMRGVAPS